MPNNVSSDRMQGVKIRKPAGSATPQKPVLRKSAARAVPQKLSREALQILEKAKRPQRLSREAFRTLIKCSIKYYLSHPIEFLWRHKCHSLFVLGTILGSLGCYLAAIFVFVIWLICFWISSIISLFSIISNIERLRYLPLVMRLHDFGWSAKLSFLSPLALALVLGILREEGGDLETSTLIIDGSLWFIVGWFISLPALCWFRKGTEGDNKYGPVPNDVPPIPGQTSFLSALKNVVVELKNAIVNLYRKHPKTMIASLIYAGIAIIPPYYDYAEYKEYKTAVDTLEKEYGVTQEDYDSALIRAAEYGSEKEVELLIRARADVNKADMFGRTPLDVASIWGRTEIVKLLEAAGAKR